MEKGRNRIFGKHGLLLILFESLLYPFLYVCVRILFCFDLIAGPQQDNANSGSNIRIGQRQQEQRNGCTGEKGRAWQRANKLLTWDHTKNISAKHRVYQIHIGFHIRICAIPYAFFAFFCLLDSKLLFGLFFFLSFFYVCVRVRFHLGFRSHIFFVVLRTILLFDKFPNRFYNATKISNLQKMHISGCSWWIRHK